MLQISHISKTFNPGTVNEKKALNGVDLHLDSGDFVTILGSNGAGKSTLFGAIAGSFVVDEGTIRLDGQNITSLPDYKRSKFIGRLFQDPLKGTAPSMTIEENLALAYLRASEKRSPFSVVTAKDRAGFREKLAQLELGLEDRMDHPVGLLSGGKGACPDEKNRGGEPHHLPDDHPQHPLGAVSGQPHHYDEQRPDRAGAGGRGAGKHDHGAAIEGVPRAGCQQ